MHACGRVGMCGGLTSLTVSVTVVGDMSSQIAEVVAKGLMESGEEYSIEGFFFLLWPVWFKFFFFLE